jgi:hypothetical protein
VNDHLPDRCALGVGVAFVRSLLARAFARLKSRRRAGLPFDRSDTALKRIMASSPEIGRKMTSGYDVETAASLVMVSPRRMPTRCIRVSQLTCSFSMIEPGVCCERCLITRSQSSGSQLARLMMKCSFRRAGQPNAVRSTILWPAGEGHVKFAVLHARDQLCRGHTFDKLDGHIGILLRIRSEQFAQKASSHGWLNTDAQTPGLTPTGLASYSARLLKLLKGFTSL